MGRKPKEAAAPQSAECYYVWDEKGEFVKFFSEQEHKGEAFKHAKELADQHEGWTITT